METEYISLEKVKKICPNCGKPMILLKSWEIEPMAKRGPRLRISLYKCDCGQTQRVVEKEVKKLE